MNVPCGDNLLIGNDNGVELDRLYDKYAAIFSYDNAATVSYVLRTDFSPAGTSLVSATLSYVPASNGRYRNFIPYSTALVDQQVYVEEITAILTSGRTGLWQTTRMAVRRVSGSDGMLLIGSDNGIELDRLYDKFTSPFAYDDAATVSFAIRTDYSPAGIAVASGTMPYVAGSRGRYRGVIPKTTALNDLQTYIEEVTADLSNGRHGFWQTPRIARRRVA